MESAKRSSISFSRSLAIAAAILIFSLPAFAYEEDTHFQMTYVICRSVGFTADEALIVAAVDQGMDDSAGTVANSGPLGAVAHPYEEWVWHALDNGGDMGAAGIIARRDQLFQLALQESNFRNKLIRLGVFFHYQQDTWGHRHHYKDNHLSRDNYTTYNTPLGHAVDVHQPDRPPFDPVAALMNLEDGIVYARRFLKEGLGREPGTFLANYSPQSGAQDSSWSQDGKYYHQIAIAGAVPNSPRRYLLSLIRAQIDTYTSGKDAVFGFRYTSNEADLASMKLALEKVCKDFEPYRSAGIPNPAINIPDKAQKVAAGFTGLTTETLLAPLNAITDGMRILDQSKGAVYLVIDGKLRWVPDTATSNNLFYPATELQLPNLDRYPIFGSKLTPGAYLAQGPTDTMVYFVVDGVKRRIGSSTVFARYGFKADAIRRLTQEQLAAIPLGPTIDNPAGPSVGIEGSRLRVPGYVYLVIDKHLREIPNSSYNSLFNSAARDTDIPSAGGYFIGWPLKDTYLTRAENDPKVYLVMDYKKRLITSESVMDSYGFDRSKIKIVPAWELAKIPDGPNLPQIP